MLFATSRRSKHEPPRKQSSQTSQPAQRALTSAGYTKLELGALNSFAPEFPLAVNATAPLRSKAESQGLDDFSPLGSGENRSGCRKVAAAQLTRDLVAEL
jgi:hypothetical protein